MTKTTTSERLKQIMSEQGLRQADILERAKPYCEKFGLKLGRNDISQYVSGKVLPKQDKLTLLGYTLNVSEAWLMGYDVSPSRDVHSNNQEKKPLINLGKTSILRDYLIKMVRVKGLEPPWLPARS